MGNPKAFLTIKRKEAGYRPVHERIYDFSEVEQTLNLEDRQLQASRCMDCGVPFCHWSCPLGNRQPEWQDLVYKGKWREAWQLLQATDDFPEFTGRVCPALCEKGCVLNQGGEPVTIRENEVAIIERAFAEGYVKPRIPQHRSGKRVAIIGSGPAGLACANQLNQRGHTITVFEQDENPGGLLRLGIPDFKLNKKVIDRRLNLLREEGIEFRCNQYISENISLLSQEYDALCIAIGAGHPRDLRVEGRELHGVHFALDYLKQQNRMVSALKVDPAQLISAKNKKVLVIGGGDTGSDCVGTAIRQGATSVIQIEIMPKPPVGKNPDTPWPYYPVVLKTTSSHQEGCERRWELDTVRFLGDNGQVKGAEVVAVNWSKDESGQMKLNHSDQKQLIEADLVLLALGFVHPVQEGVIRSLDLNLDKRKNIAIDENQKTSHPAIFASGDASYGAGLVVRAIASGRKTAQAIHQYLLQTEK